MVFWGQKDRILRGFVPKRSFLCWWMRKNTPKRSCSILPKWKKGVKTAAHMYHPSHREYPPPGSNVNRTGRAYMWAIVRDGSGWQLHGPSIPTARLLDGMAASLALAPRVRFSFIFASSHVTQLQTTSTEHTSVWHTENKTYQLENLRPICFTWLGGSTGGSRRHNKTVQGAFPGRHDGGPRGHNTYWVWQVQERTVRKSLHRATDRRQ